MNRSESRFHQVEALTPREQRVLELLVGGHSNREIADLLFVCEDTTKYHLKNIYGKLGVRRRTHAVLRALQAGLVRPLSASA